MRSLLLMITLATGLMLAACEPAPQTSPTAETMPQPQAPNAVVEDQDSAEEIYRQLHDLLDVAYAEQNRPEPSFDSMVAVKDAAFALAQEERANWPAGVSYSLSAMDDHVYVHVSHQGVEKAGDWTPGE